jgi:hypothetical protein
MSTTLLALLISLLPLQAAQNLPPAFPREGAKQVINNERVTVWDVTWPKGNTAQTYRLPFDTVSVELSARKGEVSFLKRGVLPAQESGTPRRTIMIELKDVTVPTLANKSGYPEAFPREGVRRLLDNPRVTVWDVSFTQGKPTPTHFHSTDVVVVYLENGDTLSTAPDGKATPGVARFGEVKLNPRNRTHSELLVKGAHRVIAVELK